MHTAQKIYLIKAHRVLKNSGLYEAKQAVEAGWVPDESHLNFGQCPPELETELTVRDQFAMAALTGMIANPGTQGAGVEMINSLAKACYIVADAMMEARKKEPKDGANTD